MKKKTAAIAAIFIVILSALTLCACKEAYKLSFEAEEITVSPEVCFTPNVKIRPKDIAYTVSSSNHTIATVEDNVVTTLKEGVVTLTVVSGDKSDTCTLYVKSEQENNAGNSGITLLKSYTVNFEIVNYGIAGLETGRLESVIAVEGGVLRLIVPNISGYIADCWYTDKECTKKYDVSATVKSDITLYAKLTERATAYRVINGFVTGLVYPNLAHEELILPEKEENGGVIYGIADKAFEGDKTIKRVVIPASYKSIGTSAFAGCTELKEVEIPTDCELHTIGTNAFGPRLGENGQMTDDCCEKLEKLYLPDTVTRLGAFAFYGCKSLDFNGIPLNLNILEQYAFAKTGINNVSLKNINSLYEGVFEDCIKLDTVTDTEQVTRCDKLVFTGTKLVADAKAVYNKNRKDDEAAYYAGTILFGCYPTFGRTVGSGKLHIKETTTLIADEAFNTANRSEFTLYLDTATANAALNRDFIGKNVFYASSGVFIVVGEGLSDEYRKRYNTAERPYYEMLVEAESVIINEQGNSDEVNWGTHIILKKRENSGYSYYYDKFVPFKEGTPRMISLSRLKLKNGSVPDVERINMNAFAGITELLELELYRVRTIAYLGVTNCRKLRAVDLTKTISPTVLEDRSAIQFSGLAADAKVYVNAGQLDIYRKIWGEYETAANRLMGA